MPGADDTPIPDSSDPHAVAAWIKEYAESLGFALVGIADASPSAFTDEFRAWLDAGKHGSMSWLADRVETRLDPAMVLEGARSVVMVGDLYATRTDLPEHEVPGHGRIARYARGRDYHKVLKRRLMTLADTIREGFPGEECRVFTDTAPVLERELAQRAGLGWTGKHTLNIHPELGSYMLLGGVLTTLKLPVQDAPEPDHCGSCTRCIDACPTDAITPYSVDATRCVSYLTIEHREAIDEDLFEGMQDRVFGCDICQEVCPHNHSTGHASSSHDARVNPDYRSDRSSFDLLEVLGWDEDARRDAFISSSMKRANLDMMKRNAIIVAGNQLRHHPMPELYSRIEAIAGDASEASIVRDSARAVLRRLGG